MAEREEEVLREKQRGQRPNSSRKGPVFILGAVRMAPRSSGRRKWVCSATCDWETKAKLFSLSENLTRYQSFFFLNIFH